MPNQSDGENLIEAIARDYLRWLGVSSKVVVYSVVSFLVVSITITIRPLYCA